MPVSLVVQPLWDSLDQAIIVTDRNLEEPGPTIHYINRAFTRLTGYRAEEAIGRSPRFLQCSRTDRETARQLKEDLRRSGRACARLVNRRKDGSEYLCSLVVTPLLGPDGLPEHFICVARLEGDTIRDMAEEQGRLQVLMDDVEEQHDAADAMVAQLRSELGRLHLRYRTALHSIDAFIERSALREQVFNLQAAEVTRSEAELSVTRGALHSVEEELRLSFAQLEDANVILMQMNERLRVLQAANADKLRLLAAASHDLRQPVMSLGLLLDVLRHRVGPDENAIMGALMAAHLSMRSLLDGLLDSARLDAGELIPEIGPVTMQALLENISREFSPQAELRGVRFRVVACSCQVASDVQLLERILRNLIGNALKYTQHGGILVGCRRSGKWLRIEVWDTGPGLPQGSQKLIFEEFRQLGTPIHDQERGVGLGLAIVARLARQLGHRIGLCSREGRGSVFSLTVPLCAHGGLHSRNPAIPPDVRHQPDP